MIVVLVFAVPVFCLVALLAVALCMAASYGDEIAERRFAELGTIADVVDEIGREAEAVVINFPRRPAA